mmetsp:Transcript_65583/g.147989  ORF Transcript_65583/g.147989 Transcript_65583/m.147989 type:complete len:125 (-) Transcript_65583:367-741(-)
MLPISGFNLGFDLHLDEQLIRPAIDSFRKIARSSGTPTPAQNKHKYLLRKLITKKLHARGMIIQEGLDWFFSPALTDPPEKRDAGSPEDQATAAESSLAALLKQVEALQRDPAVLLLITHPSDH